MIKRASTSEKRRHSGRSMRSRMRIWFLAVAFVPVLLYIVIDYIAESRSIEILTTRKLTAIRDLKAEQLNRWLDERIGDLHTMSEEEDVTSIIERMHASRERTWDTSGRAELAAFLSLLVDHYDAYRNAVLMFVDDEVIVHSVRKVHVAEKAPLRHLLDAVQEHEEIQLSGMYNLSGDADAPQMWIAAPVHCNAHAGAHLIAVLILEIDLERSVYPLMMKRIGLGETGETLLVNRKSVAVTALRWHDDAALKLKIFAEPAALAASGRNGVIEAEDYRGEEVLAAYTFLPRFGWGLVAKQDLSELTAPLQERTQSLLLGLAGALVIVLLLASLLAGKLTRPIGRIAVASNRMAAGSYEIRIGDQENTELQQMADSFNAMAAAIQHRLELSSRNRHVLTELVTAAGLKVFAERTATHVGQSVDALIAMFYSRSANGDVLLPSGGYGYATDEAPVFSTRKPDGQLGRAVAAGGLQFIRLDQDTEFIFRTIAGTIVPTEFATLPLVIDGELRGAILLAKARPFSDLDRDLLESISLELHSAFHRVLDDEERARLATDLQESNQELESMTEELQQQSEELRLQNIELGDQKTRLVEANRIKGEFLSNMSHELRTPLNAIMTLSRALSLQAGERLTPEEHEYLDIVRTNGKNLLLLINDLLDLSRLDAGTMRLHVTRFDITVLLQDIIQGVSPIAEEKGIDLEITVPDVPVIVQSDERNIRMIVQNIVANAVKFTEQGGVTVQAQEENDAIIIDVHDTGIGIPASQLPSIFDEFRQVDGTTSRQYEGTGLGLAIAAKAAALLNGRITAESQEGEGSHFRVILPAKLEDVPASLPHPPLQGHPRQGSPRPRPPRPRERRRLLIVEDNETIILQLRGTLRDEGYEIRTINRGDEAIDAMRSWKPDVVLLDLMLPALDGFSVIEQMQGEDLLRRLPVIVLTAKDLTSDERFFLTRHGRMRVLQKGEIDEEELLISIYDIVEDAAASSHAADGDGV